MSARLPGPLAAYFSATKHHDVAAMLAPFAEGAVVKDEGQERHGLEAIREWMEETIRKYRFTVEVTDVAKTDGKLLVTVLVAGHFPGSPVKLRYAFTLDREKIARLEIS